MDDKEKYLKELLYEAKRIREQLDNISSRLRELEKIEEDIKDFKRVYERKN